MLNYKHVLITTDLSGSIDKVTDHALAIAKRSNAKVSIVHVIEHTPIIYGGGEFSIPLDINLEETIRESASEVLRAIGKRLSIPEENQYIEMGSVKRAVLELADKLGIDLILVGTHGRHGVEKILGSTANALLHAAKCDVLSVRTYD